MPGIVAFRRKWNIGSDDLVVPASVMFVIHVFWVVIVIVSLIMVPIETKTMLCIINVQGYAAGFAIILTVCAGIEALVVWIGMRGTILHTEPRANMQYLIYSRLGLLVVELFWLVLGVVWIAINSSVCADLLQLKAILCGAVVCDWLLLVVLLAATWYVAVNSPTVCSKSQCCVLTHEQNSVDQSPGSSSSGGGTDRVDGSSTDRQHSTIVLNHTTPAAFTKGTYSLVAASQLFSGFLADLDLLTTDVFAGLLLLRQRQKSRQACILLQGTNEVYEFLSGVSITPSTRFLSLRLPEVLHNYKKTVHFMRYVLVAANGSGYVKCAGTNVRSKHTNANAARCNCCTSSRAASISGLDTLSMDCPGCHYCIPHAIFHKQLSDRGQLSFSVYVDHTFKAVVVAMSTQLAVEEMFEYIGVDVDVLPTEPPHDDWLVHKEILQLALDVRQTLRDETWLTKAFNTDSEKGTSRYSLVLVGHCVGAGVAAVLSILLHSEYPTVHCYAYSPPASLLSAACAEETKAFITAVVVGKDIFPRIGLNQLETFRQDLSNAIKKSTEPKWKIIVSSLLPCSRDNKMADSNTVRSTAAASSASTAVVSRPKPPAECRVGRFCRNGGSPMLLALHTPMYPPGRIIHVVRSHPKDTRRSCGRRQEVIYQAVWAENADFDQILVSPTMIADHLPDMMFNAMRKVMTRVSPLKPSRKPVKPSHELLIGSSDASHFTNEDITEPMCVASTAHCVMCSAPEDPRIHFVPADDGGVKLDIDTVVKRRGICFNERGLRPRSFPPSALPGMLLEEWLGVAPLATPETLSESSSLASYGSGNAIYQRVTSSVLPRMDPILQSPARSANSRDCCLYLESADIVGDLAMLSPCVEQLPLPLAPCRPFGCEPDILLGPSSSASHPTAAGDSCAPDFEHFTSGNFPPVSEMDEQMVSNALSPDVIQQSLNVDDTASVISEYDNQQFVVDEAASSHNDVTFSEPKEISEVCYCDSTPSTVLVATPDVIPIQTKAAVDSSVLEMSPKLPSYPSVENWTFTLNPEY